MDEDELESAWTWTAQLNAAGSGFETRIVFHFKDAKNYLMLRAGGTPVVAGSSAVGAKAQRLTLGFWRVANGHLERLGDPQATISVPAARSGAGGKTQPLAGQLSIQRSAWRVRALWNGRAIVTAYNDFAGGRFGVATRGAAKLAAARMQPVGEPPFLRDDFMRAEGPDAPETAGLWRRAAGIWKTSGLLGPRADAAMNPNPFVFRASAPSRATPNRVAASGAASGASGATVQPVASGPRAKGAKKGGPAAVAAVATAGKWFWSDYSVSAAVRPALKDRAAPLTAGVAAYRQSDGACVAGVVDFRQGRARIEVAGRAPVVSAPFGIEPNQWHRIFLDPGPGTLRLVVDGVERVRVNSAQLPAAGEPAQGEAALLATVSSENFVDFDDVRIGPNDAVSDDFSAASVGRWQDVAGEWQTKSAAARNASHRQHQLMPDPNAPETTRNGANHRVKLSAGRALTLTGSAAREEGQIEAVLQTNSAASRQSPFGIAFAARDGRNFFVARLRGVGGESRLEIVEYTNGAGRILATQTPDKKPPVVVFYEAGPQWNDMPLAVEWREGIITARGQGMAVTAAVGAVPAGRVGVWADGPAQSVALRSFRALGAAPGWGEDALPDRFTKDRLMKHWASNASLWREDKPGVAGYAAGGRDGRRVRTLDGRRLRPTEPEPASAPSDTTGIRWHAGDFFGAASLSLPLPSPPAGRGVQLMIGAAPDAPDAGARLDIERAGDKIVLRLLEGGRVLQSASLPAAGAAGGGASGELRFVRRPVGDGQVNLRVALSGLVLLSKTAAVANGSRAAQQNARTKIGVRAGAIPNFDWEKVRAQTPNVLDYAFTGAPVDWRAGKGRWEVAERWTCQPQWGFFGGSYSVNPTLWSRFATRGDFTLEAYLATPMDVTRSERGPVDLNLTVGGDGRDLASGYSFLFGANGRSFNRVLRGNEIVAEKPFGTAPAGVGDTHQDWFYIRLERRRTPQGLMFRYSVNGQEMWQYLDPNPLPGALADARHIAFWTYNGGLSIARVRLWHSGLESRQEGGNRKDENDAPSAPASLKNALGEWSVRSEGSAVTGQEAAGSGPDVLRVATDGGRSALRVVNPHSGGDWTLFATQKDFDAKQHPVLRFDYRVPEDVFVNLYARVDGTWREIVFAGDAKRLMARARGKVGAGVASPAMVVTEKMGLGRIADVVADDKWHSASFNLLEALQKAGVGTRVEALAFAAPDYDYLRAGLGGNPRGATYWLRDFQAPTTKDTPALASAR